MAIAVLVASLSVHTCGSPRPLQAARQLRGREPRLQQPQQASALELLLGNMAKAAETATQAAGEAADNWINSGWQVFLSSHGLRARACDGGARLPQVKKRAGQVIPEIRPNAVDVKQRSDKWLRASGDSGGAGLRSADRSAASSSASAAEAGALDPAASASLANQSEEQLQAELSLRTVCVADPCCSGVCV